VRRLDSLTVQPLAKADSDLFWSPDSRFIVFLQDGKLMKIEASGGVPQIICNAGLVVGGSWNRDGTIIFGDSTTISRVPARGGQAVPITSLYTSREETEHGWPVFLPDGRHFLYVIYSARRENGGVYVGSLDSPEARVRLLEEISNVEYAPGSPGDTASGYLLFARGAMLMAQRFAPGNLQFKGEAFPVVEQIARSAGNTTASFSASDNGELFVNSTNLLDGDRMTWFDRAGKRLGTIGTRGLHLHSRLSPDQTTLAVDQRDPPRAFHDIWLLPVARDVSSRFYIQWSDKPGLVARWPPHCFRVTKRRFVREDLARNG